MTKVAVDPSSADTIGRFSPYPSLGSISFTSQTSVKSWVVKFLNSTVRSHKPGVKGSCYCIHLFCALDITTEVLLKHKRKPTPGRSRFLDPFTFYLILTNNDIVVVRGEFA